MTGPRSLPRWIHQPGPDGGYPSQGWSTPPADQDEGYPSQEWGTPPGEDRGVPYSSDGVPPPARSGGYPSQGWGTLPWSGVGYPQDRTADEVVDTRRAVCLLRSNRRTFLFEYGLSSKTKMLTHKFLDFMQQHIDSQTAIFFAIFREKIPTAVLFVHNKSHLFSSIMILCID